MDQLPLGDGQLNARLRRQKSPNARPSIPLPVMILGGIALVVVLFCAVVLVKMGAPAPTQDVEAELSL